MYLKEDGNDDGQRNIGHTNDTFGTEMKWTNTKANIIRRKKVDFLLRLLTFLAISVQKKNICSNPEKEDCHLGL
jgi:hypothetical protein